MTFVTPWLAALAAAIAVPALLLLYFLKLRRSPVRIPSTLLWRKSFEDLQVNTPFQRIRWSWLLLVQGLLLAALILAMAQPRGGGGDEGSSRLIVLIDRSASMNATDGGPDGMTRLDAAKESAREFVRRLGRGDQARQLMIIDFGATAAVRTGFETRRQVLLDAIDSIEPTDEEADLDAALELAGAFASQREDSTEEAPDVMLLSDGVVGTPPRAGGFRLRSGNFSFIRVGPDPASDEPVENIGVTALSARRDLDDPAQVDVFARLINAGGEQREVVASLTVDGGEPLLSTQVIPGFEGGRPGEAELRFSFQLPAGGLIVLRHNLRDDLPVDDAAALVMPPPRRPRVAIVTPDDESGEQAAPEPDQFLLELIEQIDVDRLNVMNASRFRQLDQAQLDAGALYDLVLFDRVRAERLPGVPTISVGAVPQSIKLIEPQRPGGKRILSWDRQHPVMRHVSLDRIVYSGFGGMELPAGATALAFGADGPVIALLGSRGVRHVMVGFSLTNSNWPLDVSLLVFAQNTLDHLLLGRVGGAGISHRPGEPITVRAAPGESELELIGPDGSVTIDVEPGEATTLPAIRRAGVYEVRNAQPPVSGGASEWGGESPWRGDRLAVSVVSESESDIRPRDEVLVNAEQAASDRLDRAAPREWWPWLIGIALGLLIIEWTVYCLRVRSV